MGLKKMSPFEITTMGYKQIVANITFKIIFSTHGHDLVKIENDVKPRSR